MAKRYRGTDFCGTKNMISLANVAQTLEKVVQPAWERRMEFTFPHVKKRLIANIKEYKKLNNRQWKKKRVFSALILAEILALEEFIPGMKVCDRSFYEWNHMKQENKDKEVLTDYIPKSMIDILLEKK